MDLEGYYLGLTHGSDEVAIKSGELISNDGGLGSFFCETAELFGFLFEDADQAVLEGFDVGFHGCVFLDAAWTTRMGVTGAKWMKVN